MSFNTPPMYPLSKLLVKEQRFIRGLPWGLLGEGFTPSGPPVVSGIRDRVGNLIRDRAGNTIRIRATA